jgi:hypothetical protein
MRNRSSNRVFTCLLLASLAMATSAVANLRCVPLVATNTSPYYCLSKLQTTGNYATYDSTHGYLYYKWPGSAPFPGAQQVTSGKFTNCTRVYQGNLCECVQFARQACNVPDSPSTAWRRSVPVVVNGQIRTDLPAGALVATMDYHDSLFPPDTAHHPHVAVFLRRINSDSIEVADQNFIGGAGTKIVGKHHRIRTPRVGGSSYQDASRYWTIYVSAR